MQQLIPMTGTIIWRVTEPDLKPGPYVIKELTGENLKVVRTKFSTFKLDPFVMHAIGRDIQARPSLEFKTLPRFCPVSLSLSMIGNDTFGQSLYHLPMPQVIS
jgi:hypothetical protein